MVSHWNETLRLQTAPCQTKPQSSKTITQNGASDQRSRNLPGFAMQRHGRIWACQWIDGKIHFGRRVHRSDFSFQIETRKLIPADCLKDLKRLLRQDDKTEDKYIFRLLGKWNFVATDLVPILCNYAHDTRLVQSVGKNAPCNLHETFWTSSR